MSVGARSEASAFSNPFGNIPGTGFFFNSPLHEGAMRRICRGVANRCGLMLLTGEIGSGKTTVCRRVKGNLPEECLFVELGNPFLTAEEQLGVICKGLGVGVAVGSSAAACMDVLTDRLRELYRAGRIPVLFIDEGHLLSRALLGQLLVLSNLREGDVPLVQLILAGQLEMLDLLRQPGLEALNQRMGVREGLRGLSRADCAAYVRYRLEEAGYPDLDVFQSAALREVWRMTGGLPRLINHVCAHALDAALLSGRGRVTPAQVREMERDAMYAGVLGARSRTRRRVRSGVACAAILGVLAFGAAAWEFSDGGSSWPELGDIAALMRGDAASVPAQVVASPTKALSGVAAAVDSAAVAQESVDDAMADGASSFAPRAEDFAPQDWAGVDASSESADEGGVGVDDADDDLDEGEGALGGDQDRAMGADEASADAGDAASADGDDERSAQADSSDGQDAPLGRDASLTQDASDMTLAQAAPETGEGAPDAADGTRSGQDANFKEVDVSGMGAGRADEAEAGDGLLPAADDPAVAAHRVGALVWDPVPSNRMAVVDDRILVEGDMLDDGMRIEGIGRDHLVVRHGDGVYRLDVRTDEEQAGNAWNKEF
ncbi:type II secretory pathway predicted ATPase ExeA [Desulfobaculum xiamenense]|uniref:Type II secretory pathway predicted ATPase ExeA n=1 Tax=Desulfobaculum xiamenense TaxID=995050 RepID=A0A846QUE2_9BACT|nr:AAA family ATPase [Desulfobaculum xiamenense]NJB68764.1 type II secretory pathway predicted ATPase ExeA [Desulfobaculum xiamenense]